LETELTAEQAAKALGADWEQAGEELGLLDAIAADHDQKTFEAHQSTPVLFGAALPNFGVARLLDIMVELAPPPAPRLDLAGAPRALAAPFSGLVFKVQANMDRAHRDRVAFVRVCSGRFQRGMVLTHAATGRPFATKYAQAVFGQERATIDEAYPGDVVGLVNASMLRPGDTLYEGTRVEFPPIPSFAPEHFATVRVRDTSKAKQFRRGIDQLDAEGVVQVLRSDLRGDQAPVLAAVGPMQFEVVQHRLATEFGAETVLDRLEYTLARLTDTESVEALTRQRGAEVLTRSRDQALLALFTDQWRMRSIQREHPGLTLQPLIADTHSDHQAQQR
jgi:peptide chain release factor 3